MREMSCEEARSAVYRAVDGELSQEEAESLRRHVDDCEKCGREYELARREAGVLREVLGEFVEETQGIAVECVGLGCCCGRARGARGSHLPKADWGR